MDGPWGHGWPMSNIFETAMCVPLAAPRLKSSLTLIGVSLKTQRKWRN